MFNDNFIIKKEYVITLDDGTKLYAEDESKLDDLYEEWLENKVAEIYIKWHEQGNIVLDEDFRVIVGKSRIKDSVFFKFKELYYPDLYYVFAYLGYQVSNETFTTVNLNRWLYISSISNYYGFFRDLKKESSSINKVLENCRKVEG